MLRLAAEDDLKAIKKIANQNREFIGFIMAVARRESIQAQSLWVAEDQGEVAGFVHYHARRDGWHTLHEIGVLKDRQGQGLGLQLLAQVPLLIRLKTTVDNRGAARFYEREGFTRVRVEEGRKRALAVYEKPLAPTAEVSPVDEDVAPTASRRRSRPRARVGSAHPPPAAKVAP